MAVMRWSEVVRVHGTVAGIATRNGRVFSLLCNQAKAGQYPDRLHGDRLTYYVGRRTQSHGIQALLKLVERPEPVRLFEKLGVNQWRDHGNWTPIRMGAQTSGGQVPVLFERVAETPLPQTGHD